jgi:hypothetical protein
MRQKGLVTKIKEKYVLIINYDDKTIEGVELVDNLEPYKELKETQVVFCSVDFKEIDEEKQELTLTDLYLISILKGEEEDTMENAMKSEYFTEFIQSLFNQFQI